MLVKLSDGLWVNADLVVALKVLFKSGNTGIILRIDQAGEGNNFHEVKQPLDHVAKIINDGIEYGIDDTE